MQATNFNDIASYRLQNQQITISEIKNAADMVRWFGAVQGQEYTPSTWGLGPRLSQLKDEDKPVATLDCRIITFLDLQLWIRRQRVKTLKKN